MIKLSLSSNPHNPMLVFTELSCPNCLAPIDLHDYTSNTIHCGSCRSHFALEGHLCPNCNSYYQNEIDNCGKCGTAMQRMCGKCQTSNWSGEEFCISCGIAMDLIDATISDFHNQNAQHKAKRLEQIREMRAKEEILSQKRMAEFQRIEEERKAAIASRKEGQQQNDSLGLFIVCSLVLSLAFAIFWLIFSI